MSDRINNEQICVLIHTTEDSEIRYRFVAPEGFEVPFGYCSQLPIPHDEFGRNLRALVDYFGIDFHPESGDSLYVELDDFQVVYRPKLEQLSV